MTVKHAAATLRMMLMYFAIALFMIYIYLMFEFLHGSQSNLECSTNLHTDSAGIQPIWSSTSRTRSWTRLQRRRPSSTPTAMTLRTTSWRRTMTRRRLRWSLPMRRSPLRRRVWGRVLEAPRAHAARSAGASAVCLPTSSGRGWGQPFRFRGLALCVFVPLRRAAFLSSMNTFNPGLSVSLQ